MNSGRLFFFLKVSGCWLRLLMTCRPLRFTDLDTDQRLLFTGSSCRLIWDIRGACLVKVYRNGKNIGSFLPKERPVIPVQISGKVEVRAFGLYRCTRRSLNLNVRELNCREAGTAALINTGFLSPPVVQDFLVRQKNMEPLTPQPVIEWKDILLDTPYRKQLETALEERLIDDQFSMEKPNPYTYGN